MKNNRFKRFLSETAIENVQKQRGVELSEEFILPKLKYKGQSGNPKMQTVRKASASEQANTEKEVSSKSRAGEKPSSASSSDSVPDVKELASKEVKPSFEFIYRDDLDLGKFWTDKAVLPNGNQKPKMIVLRVDLPEVQTSSEVELDVMKSDVSLYVPEKYKLKVQTAHPVDFKNARAQFDKNKRRLEVVMPTC
ncbi:protein kintoun [Selaginella moellendorffii]|nr:protein kintoun [Selaginella moellendorffii]|eukprot:XP_024525600.1 protein kintoun [Selaginella moellendorffii]